MSTDNPSIPAILLAGGRATRMGGGDKCLRLLAGRPILAHVVEVIAQQAGSLILNANGDPARFATFGLPVVADDLADHPGPLAGILAGLDWVASNFPASELALCVSTDCPFLPPDLVPRLGAALTAATADIALAESAGRAHPVIGLWRVDLRADLRRAMTQENLRKVERFCDRHQTVRVNFPTDPVDPFFNINSEADLAVAEADLVRQNRAGLQ